MTDARKPLGYVDQTAKTLENMHATHEGDEHVQEPAPKDDGIKEVLGAIKTLSSNLFALTSTVQAEARKNDTDRGLTNSAIRQLQAEVLTLKAGAPRLPTVPPPPSLTAPERDPLTSTGQHAIIVAGAALQAAESAHVAATAATAQAVAVSIDYGREQEKAKAEMYGYLRDIVASGAKSMKLYLAIGGVLFTAATAVGGYFTVREANKDTAKDTAAEVKKEINK